MKDMKLGYVKWGQREGYNRLEWRRSNLVEWNVVEYFYGNKSVGLIMNEKGKMHVRKYELVAS